MKFHLPEKRVYEAYPHIHTHLPEESKQRAVNIHDFMASGGCKTVGGGFGEVEFKFHGTLAPPHRVFRAPRERLREGSADEP